MIPRKWITNLLKQPACWLILQGLGTLFLLGISGHLRPQWEPDSYTYSNPHWQSLASTLNNPRTVGYPLLVMGLERVMGSLQFLPVVHWGIHLGAVLLFYGGLCRLKIAPWSAMIVASTLFYTTHFSEYCCRVLTDGPASSLAIGTVGLLLWVIGARQRKAMWIWLTLALFATYQVRPSYLYLVPLVPALGLSLFRLCSLREEWRNEWKGLGLRLTLTAMIPFLAFASFRYTMVGHFGLVSFGSYNLIGIAGQFLTEDMVAELPEDLRGIASDAIRRRQLMGHGASVNLPIWQSAYRTNGGLHFAALVEMYNPTINCLLGAAIVYSFNEKNIRYDQVMMNQKMGDMSLAIIKARPLVYAEWVLKAFGHGLSYVWDTGWSRRFKLFLVLLGACNALAIWKKWANVSERVTDNATPQQLLKVMGLLFFSFTFCSLLLTILVEVPIDRYVTAAGVFLPALLTASLISLSAGMFQERSRVAEREPS